MSMGLLLSCYPYFFLLVLPQFLFNCCVAKYLKIRASRQHACVSGQLHGTETWALPRGLSSQFSKSSGLGILFHIHAVGRMHLLAPAEFWLFATSKPASLAFRFFQKNLVGSHCLPGGSGGGAGLKAVQHELELAL